ncbi:MAG: hypothetical protein AAF618_00235 [Pseudomonadota bacterium]
MSTVQRYSGRFHPMPRREGFQDQGDVSGGLKGVLQLGVKTDFEERSRAAQVARLMAEAACEERSDRWTRGDAE